MFNAFRPFALFDAFRVPSLASSETPEPGDTDNLLLESGSALLLESDDLILLEAA